MQDVKADIEERLFEFVARRGRIEFDWQQSNCSHFTSAWVQEVEGWSFLDGIPMPSNYVGIAKMVSRQGGLRQWITRLLDRDEIDPHDAVTGDMVWMDDGTPCGALGICAGKVCVFPVDGEGATFLPLDHVDCAWTIGR